MGTKNDPGAFDCYANAEPDEPMFILLGRDPAAAYAVYSWCMLRVRAGLNKKDDTQIVDARASAKKMLDFAIKKGRARAVLALLLEVFKKDLK